MKNKLTVVIIPGNFLLYYLEKSFFLEKPDLRASFLLDITVACRNHLPRPAGDWANNQSLILNLQTFTVQLFVTLG